jgi:hypothetical protein
MVYKPVPTRISTIPRIFSLAKMVLEPQTIGEMGIKPETQFMKKSWKCWTERQTGVILWRHVNINYGKEPANFV